MTVFLHPKIVLPFLITPGTLAGLLVGWLAAGVGVGYEEPRQGERNVKKVDRRLHGGGKRPPKIEGS